MAYPSTSEEIEARISALAGKFEETATREELPNRTNEAPPGSGSATGRTVTFLRIGTGTGERRPRVVLVAGVHAREWAPPDALLTFVEKLLAAYATKATTKSAMVYAAVTDTRKSPTLTYKEFTIPFTDVQAIVEQLELYVLPLVNPDGRAFSMTPGHRGWRKNRRPAPPGKTCPPLPSGLSAADLEVLSNDPAGVDLNRNFDIAWNIDAFYSTAAAARVEVSSDECSSNQIFHGPSPLSEPETRNVQKLILDKKPGFYMDIHAAGRKIEFPWGFEENQSADPTQTFRNREKDRKPPDATGTGGRDGLTGSAYAEWMPPGVEAAHDALGKKMAEGILKSTGFTAAHAAADPVAAEVRKRSSYDPVQSAKVSVIPGASDDFAFSTSIGSTPGPPVKAVAKDPMFVYTLEIGHEDENLFWPAAVVEYPKIEREVAAALLEFLRFAVTKRAVAPPVPPPKPGGKVRKHKTSALEIQTTGILLAGTGEHEVQVLGALAEVPAPLPPALKENLAPVGDEATRDRYLSGELRGDQEDPDKQPFNPQVPAFFVTTAGEALFLERDWSGIELASADIPEIPDVAPAASGGGGGGGGGGAAALPVPLFPTAVADPLQPNAAFQAALDAAVDPIEKRLKVAKGGLTVRFAFAEVTDPAKPFPFAGYGADQMDFIASEAKVEVMYAAFALRDMAQRFADATSATSLADLVSKLTAQMNPAIRAAVPEIASATNITDTQRDPGYTSKGGKLDIDMLTATPRAAGGLDVAFTPDFKAALEGMIVPSSDDSAASCVHGVGYGYMDGALAAGGFFDRTATPAPGIGLWEAGDFQEGRLWPFVSIPTPNNDLGAQLGTARQMAKLVSLIFTKRILNATACNEMLDLLAKAATGRDGPWSLRPAPAILKPGSLTHNKLGLSSNRRSEVSVFQAPVAAARNYVVAWQNLRGLTPITFDDVARVIKNTITTFEAPPPPPPPPPPTP